MTCDWTTFRISVIARCPATPSTCESAKEVVDCTMVAIPAASAKVVSSSTRLLPITSSIRNLDVPGRTRPARRLINRSPKPSARR